MPKILKLSASVRRLLGVFICIDWVWPNPVPTDNSYPFVTATGRISYAGYVIRHYDLPYWLHHKWGNICCLHLRKVIYTTLLLNTLNWIPVILCVERHTGISYLDKRGLFFPQREWIVDCRETSHEILSQREYSLMWCDDSFASINR